MKVLYFGWVRSKIGVQREDVEPPPEVADVRGLIAWLRQRSPEYDVAFRDLSAVRIAVNQELTDLDSPVAANDEVAMFPPMTGG